MMSRITLSTEKAWLDSVPLSHMSFSTILSEQVTLVSGDGFSVPIPASFLLASSKLLRDIYLPDTGGQDIFLPSVMGETLLLAVELLRSGTTGVIVGVEKTGQKFKEVQGVMDLLQTGVNVSLKTANPRAVWKVENSIHATTDSSLQITQVCSKFGDDQEENSPPLIELAGNKPIISIIQYPKVNLQRLSKSILGMDQKVKEVHRNNNSDHAIPPFHIPCQLCPKIFTKKSNLRKHLRIIHSETTYSCPDCDLRFIHHRNMKKHRKVVHNGVCYQCTQCECNFRSKYNLNRHTRKKHEVKTKLSSPVPPPPARSLDIQCLTCDKSFGSRNNMMRHYNVIHEGMRFTCEDCGFMSGARLRVVKHCHRSQHDSETIKMVYILLD